MASIAASNAIENITVAPNRVERMAKAGEQRFRNRNEREFAGYRDAIDEITRGAGAERISVPFILHLHRQLYRHVDGRGGYLKTKPNLIVSHEEGRRRILFEPPPPEQTDFLLTELVDRYNSAADAAAAHPLLLIAAFCLDLLAIHPVANGNGRLSRLLTTHLLLQRGYGVPRFSSVERRIFETKSAYYEALEESQRGWHEARHDVWPWVDYLTAALADAYADFEAKVLSHRNLVGLSKQDRVRTYVLQHANVSFQINDIRRALPGVSDPTIRIVLRALIHEGQLMIDGLGREATYAKTGLPDSAGG